MVHSALEFVLHSNQLSQKHKRDEPKEKKAPTICTTSLFLSCYSLTTFSMPSVLMAVYKTKRGAHYYEIGAFLSVSGHPEGSSQLENFGVSHERARGDREISFFSRVQIRPQDKHRTRLVYLRMLWAVTLPERCLNDFSLALLRLAESERDLRMW